MMGSPGDVQITEAAFWLQKAGNAREEYEDAYAQSAHEEWLGGERRYAVADGATETSFSGLWAQILAAAFVAERVPPLHALVLSELAAQWHGAIADRTRDKPLPWYAEEKLQRGAFSSLIGLSLRADGSWRAFCVGDSCLFHVRPRRAIRAFPYHLPEQFTNHPALISTHSAAADELDARIARGHWQPGDTFLLMTDALAHYFLSQRLQRALLLSDALDQAGFEALVAAARADRTCRNDDVTLLKICLSAAASTL